MSVLGIKIIGPRPLEGGGAGCAVDRLVVMIQEQNPHDKTLHVPYMLKRVYVGF